MEVCNFPYNKITNEIYVSGCTFNCEECHNPELQDYSIGMDWKNTSIYLDEFWENKFVGAVSILGGDLLCQDRKDISEFCMFLKEKSEKYDKDLWLFTGFDLKSIKLMFLDDLSYLIPNTFKYIKTGQYDNTKKSKTPFASSNQKLYIFSKEKNKYTELTDIKKNI